MKNILYADSGLKSNLGHHAQSARAITAGLKELGCEVDVAAFQGIDSQLSEELSAGRVFRHYCYHKINHDPIAGWMSDFIVGGQTACDDLGTIARDGSLIYWNSAQAAQFFGLILYLHIRPHSRAVVEFGTGVGLETRLISEDRVEWLYPDPRVSANSTLYRYCSLLLDEHVRPRITMATFDHQASELFSVVLDAPVEVLPIPRNAHPNPVLRGQKPILTISFLGHQRIGDKGYQFVPSIVREVLERAKFSSQPRSIKFLIHNGDAQSSNPQMQELQKQVRHLQVEYPNQVEVDERLADDVIWQELLDKSDLIVCPYWPERFYGSYSAVACEAVANGIPLVVPRGTSMEFMLASNMGSGFCFAPWESKPVADAILSLLDRYLEFSVSANESVSVYRQKHGASRTAKAILDNLS